MSALWWASQEEETSYDQSLNLRLNTIETNRKTKNELNLVPNKAEELL